MVFGVCLNQNILTASIFLFVNETPPPGNTPSSSPPSPHPRTAYADRRPGTSSARDPSYPR